VKAGRLDPRGDVRGVPQEPDPVAGADRQPAGVGGQPHRPVEGADQHGQPSPGGPGDQQFVGWYVLTSSDAPSSCSEATKLSV
jgi:hypothetical protein